MMKLTTEQIERVRSLEDEAGRILPDHVVEDAKDKKSPLHSLFEWDRSKAAMAHWIHQAREIIGAVHIVVTNQTTVVRTPIYMRDPDAKGQGYRSVTALRAEPTAARESLIYTLRVASGHLQRALELSEPLGLASEVDGLIEQILGLQRKIQQAA